MDWKAVHDRARADIRQARRAMKLLEEEKVIAAPDRKMLRDALDRAVRAVRSPS
jgi:uncharacterized membrane protein